MNLTRRGFRYTRRYTHRQRDADKTDMTKIIVYHVALRVVKKAKRLQHEYTKI